IPFGGRDKELARLDSWLANEDAPSRFVLAAPAGRGKSALISHWLRRLEPVRDAPEPPNRWRVAFVPISMRFGTSRPAVYYEALAARLADVLDCVLSAGASDPEEYYEEQCRILLDEVNERGIHLLLVIDGIDESSGELFTATWFPR